MASASVVRLSCVAANVAAMRGGSAELPFPQRRSRPFARRVDQAEMLALVTQRVGDRVADRHLESQRIAVLRRFAAGREHGDLRGAPRERRQPHVDADRRDVLRLRAGSCAPAGRGRGARATRAIGSRIGGVQQQAGIAAAGPRVRRRAACARALRDRRRRDTRRSARRTGTRSCRRRSPCTGAARRRRGRRRRESPASSTRRCIACSRSSASGCARRSTPCTRSISASRIRRSSARARRRLSPARADRRPARNSPAVAGAA